MSSRFYTINGRVYPSVTTILDVLNKPQLVNWAVQITRDYLKEELISLQQANSLEELDVESLLIKCAKEHNRVKSAAADHGTDIHRRISAYLDNKGNIDYHKNRVIYAFRVWQEKAKFAPTATEKLVYSRKHGYAGTADLIGSLNGRLALFDIKTGRSVYPEYKLQLAAYAVAWGEMTGHFAEVCANLHFRNNAVVQANTFTASELFPLFQTFLAAKQLFDWLWPYSESKKF
jgi:hypothetical protein